MRFSRLVEAWNVFFFARKSPLSLAIFRIGIGLLLIQFVILLSPDLDTWYGPHGVLSRQCIANQFGFPVLNLLDLLPASLQSINVVFGLLLISAVGLTLGLKSRICAACAFLSLVTIYHANPFIQNSGDTYMRQQLFWLIFSQSGDVLSIGSSKKGKNPFAVCLIGEAWPQRMMQLQFCLVYADSIFSKLSHPDWTNGYAVYYTSRLVDLQRLPLPIFDNIVVCQLLTWGTLCIELSLCTLIWFKPVRYPLLILGFIFHVIIDWHMNIPQFEWLMILSFFLFIDAQDLSLALMKLEKFWQKAKLPG